MAFIISCSKYTFQPRAHKCLHICIPTPDGCGGFYSFVPKIYIFLCHVCTNVHVHIFHITNIAGNNGFHSLVPNYHPAPHTQQRTGTCFFHVRTGQNWPVGEKMLIVPCPHFLGTRYIARGNILCKVLILLRTNKHMYPLAQYIVHGRYILCAGIYCTRD